MRILEIELASPSPAGQLAFYADRLDLPIEGDAVRVGTTLLRFVDGVTSGYHVAFAIPENQIERGRRWLSERVVLLSDEIYDFPHWNAHAVYFEDADHNVLELIARHDLENADTRSFSSTSLLGASEVGLAVADAPATVKALEHELGVPFFSGNRDTFTALGSDDGVFIVVPAGHRWFPTDRLAEEAPLHVVVVAARPGVLRLSDRITIVGR